MLLFFPINFHCVFDGIIIPQQRDTRELVKHFSLFRFLAQSFEVNYSYHFKVASLFNCSNGTIV